MFNSKDNLQQTEDQLTGDQAALSADHQAVEELSEDDVHTMPSNYLGTTPALKERGRVSWIVLGAIIFVVLGLIITAAVIFFVKQKNNNSQPELNINIAVPNDNQNTNTSTTTNSNVNTNVNQSLDTPPARDQKRLADINEIRTALAVYYTAKGAYPDTLSSLVSDYLKIIPDNPSPNGEAYVYLPSADKSDYTLTFSIEESVNVGNLKLISGKYQVGPAGNFMPYNANQPPPVSPTSTQPLKPVMGLDSDSDGLSDIEENVYKTNSTLPDTDGDGYKDGDEVVSLYDPTKAGAKLIDSGLVKVFTNNEQGYSVFYPATWTFNFIKPDKSELFFNSSNGEFVSITTQANPLNLSALDWFKNQAPNADTSGFTTLLVGGFPAIQTADGLTTYLSAGSKIYAILYNIGTNKEMYFYSTYKMFLKSFSFNYASKGSQSGGTNATANARDARRMSDLRAIQSALELYLQDNNSQLPPAKQSWADFGGQLTSYLSPLPVDPTNNTVNYYSLCMSGSKYLLMATLETANSTALVGQVKGYDNVCLGSSASGFHSPVASTCGEKVFCLGNPNGSQ